jgi:hypothetical protein
MEYQHKNLAGEKWNSMTFFEQMANIGSEVGRAINRKSKGDTEYCRMALERALELLDFTISDPKNIKKLKELVRTREMLSDYFAFENEYHSTEKSWQNYFYSFNFAARINH